MSGRQADKLALGVTGLIGFVWAAATLHSYVATAASGASLLAVLQVLAEVCLAGGESGDAPEPSPPQEAHPLGTNVFYTATDPHP